MSEAIGKTGVIVQGCTYVDHEAEHETFGTKFSKTVLLVFKKTGGIIAFFALWEFASRAGLIDSILIPPFTKIVVKLYEIIITGELPYHMAVSLRRVGMGLLIGICFSVPMGLLIGRSKKIETFLDPILQMFRQTSSLALVPVFLLLFGIKETSKVLIIYWGVQWPVLLNTINGVKNVDPVLIKSARSMGSSAVQIFLKIIIPATLPSIFTGIRLSGTTAILMLTAAEMVGASSGLGFLVYDFQIRYLIPEMFAVIATFSILGLILNYLLVFLEKRATVWRQEDTNII